MIAKIENILNESKASIYIADGLENPIDNPLLHRHFKNEGESCLIPFNFTSDINKASLILIPSDIWNWRNNKEYISFLKNLSLKKPLLITNSTDFYTKRPIQNAIYLRYALNPGENAPNTIVVPYPIKPIYAARSITPDFSISFSGYVPDRFIGRFFRAAKNSPLHPIKGNGSIVRKLMIYKMKNTNLELRLKILSNYSGHYFRFEELNSNLYNSFVESITRSRYVLCPRGDANQSQRFFEVLSAGRIPIMINSDIVMPKNNLLDLNRVFINLNISESTKVWERKIRQFNQTIHSDEKFMEISKKIVHIYENELSYFIFISRIFKNYLE